MRWGDDPVFTGGVYTQFRGCRWLEVDGGTEEIGIEIVGSDGRLWQLRRGRSWR